MTIIALIALGYGYFNCHCSDLRYAWLSDEEIREHCRAYFSKIDDEHTAAKMCRDQEFIDSWIESYDSLKEYREEVLEGLVDVREFEFHCCPSTNITCYLYALGKLTVFPLGLTVFCHLLVKFVPRLFDRPRRLLREQ